MNIIVLKYVQLVCVAFFFDTIKCDNLPLEAARDDILLNREAACMAACMETNLTSNLSDCYKNCKSFNKTVKLNETQSDEGIELICRDYNALTIKVDSSQNLSGINESRGEQRQYTGELYLIRLQETDTLFPQKIVYIADTPHIKIENLTQNTSYNVTASIFTGKFEYRHLNTMKVFKTLVNDSYRPEPISNATIKIDYATNSNKSNKIFTSIDWSPANDMVCHYLLNLYGTEDTFSEHLHEFRRITNPKQLYSYQTGSLKFDSEYVLEINAINTKDERIEGNKASYKFRTPTCWEFHDYNMTICRPLPLINISSTHDLLRKDFYKINVTWEAQMYPPDYYNVTINLYLTESAVSQNISGTQNYAYFSEVYIPDMNYDILVVAVSKGGFTENIKEVISLKEIYTSFWERYRIVLTGIGILLSFVVLLSVSLIFLAIQNRRNKLKHKNEILSRENRLREMARSHNKDVMEVDPVNVKLQEKLGEGAFGIVKRGILLPKNQFVAVKMLKENAGSDDIEEFLGEIAIMKSVFQHENIVGIVGHSTINYNRMMLLTEYCSKGNLLNYLRFFRPQCSCEQPFISTRTETFLTPSPRKNPSNENIFNFDSKVVDKLSPQEKSISVSAITQESLSDILKEKESKARLSESNMHNVIFNRLYDENITGNGLELKHRNTIIMNKNNGRIVDNNLKDISIKFTGQNNFKKSVDESVNPLFAENQCYDMVLPTEIEPKAILVKQDNHLVDIDPKLANKMNGEKLTSEDLLMFAKQIATGMEFLANNKIVHRDLAARNVLVCEDKTIKIADFGLSRDIYVDNVYMKLSPGRLPVKWLALESMTKQEYTSQSDVWSYGILLYEIVTLGCTPYPTIPNNHIPDYIKFGNRMLKPHNCSKEFFELMTSCWLCEPKKRPTFTDILHSIDDFNHRLRSDELIQVETLGKNKCCEHPITVDDNSDSSYLKPI